MTPKQKAIELIEKFQNIEFETEGLDDYLEPNTCNMGIERVKQCCLICIEEILSIGVWESQEMAEQENTPEYCEEFWIWVKYEIEILCEL